jgi:hypothetical protein
MRTRGKGLKKEVWYSICSAHRDYKEDCSACNTGSWYKVWKVKVESIIYWISPRFWRWYVNR